MYDKIPRNGKKTENASADMLSFSFLLVAARSHGIAYSIPQACNPKAVAMAVNTVMAIWRIFPHTVFLFSLLIVCV